MKAWENKLGLRLYIRLIISKYTFPSCIMNGSLYQKPIIQRMFFTKIDTMFPQNDFCEFSMIDPQLIFKNLYIDVLNSKLKPNLGLPNFGV